MMKAICYAKYGTPKDLRLKEVAIPALKDNEVLINVYAATVNRTDCAIVQAKPFIMRFFTGLLKPRNPIPGSEFAGKIVAVGSMVKSFSIGDKVFGFDELGLSAYAQYLALSEDRGFTTIPGNIIYTQAAASSEGAYYAHNFMKKVNIKRGQKILVNGATGGIGSALVQFLAHAGADVTAVCGTQNMALVKSLGANKVIDYTREDFTKENLKYDFVFDAVGKSSFAKCKPLLVPKGIYISSELGWMAENVFFALFTPWFGGKKVIFPVPTDIKASLIFIRGLMEQEKFKAVIDRTYPLEQIAEAFRYVETGQKIGNVVISMPPAIT